MKSYSNDVVTKSDIAAIDEKQSKQIRQLRVWMSVITIVNFVALIGCYAACRM